MTGPDATTGGESDAPHPGDHPGEGIDYHPADLTADQMGYVRREAADRAASAEAGAPGAAGEGPVPGATADSAPPADAQAPVEGEPGGEVDASQAAILELTGDLKRSQAEFVNYKRRVERDRELVKQNATYTVLTTLMPVLDDIDRAREHGEVEGGFKAVADSLDRAVATLGLEKFAAPGDEFDPNLHEALMHGHSAEVTTTTVEKVVQAGYRIGERVVRAAKVTVLGPEG